MPCWCLVVVTVERDRAPRQGGGAGRKLRCHGRLAEDPTAETSKPRERGEGGATAPRP
jgi:hypothetical protein